jgi:hypothetical protein
MTASEQPPRSDSSMETNVLIVHAPDEPGASHEL